MKRNGMVLQEDISMSEGLRVRETLCFQKCRQTGEMRRQTMFPERMAVARSLSGGTGHSGMVQALTDAL